MNIFQPKIRSRGVRILLAGNVQFLEQLQKKYGKHATISEIIDKEVKEEQND